MSAGDTAKAAVSYHRCRRSIGAWENIVSSRWLHYVRVPAKSKPIDLYGTRRSFWWNGDGVSRSCMLLRTGYVCFLSSRTHTGDQATTPWTTDRAAAMDVFIHTCDLVKPIPSECFLLTKLVCTTTMVPGSISISPNSILSATYI